MVVLKKLRAVNHSKNDTRVLLVRRYARCWWHLTLHIINVERTFRVFFFIVFFLICVCISWVWLGWRWDGCVLMYCSSFRNFIFCFYWFLFLFSLACLYMCCWCFPVRCLFQCLCVCLFALLFFFRFYSFFVFIYCLCYVNVLYQFFFESICCSKMRLSYSVCLLID